MKVILTESDYQRLVQTLEYQEERKSLFEEKYNSLDNNAKEIFHELYESVYGTKFQNINENWLNTVADVVGIFDPTGLVDIANGISYLYQGDTFFGILSMVSAIPYVGDAVAKPILLMGRGSKIVQATNKATKLAKAGKVTEANKLISQVANYNSLTRKFFGSIRNWAPKLKSMVDKIPGGKLSAGLRGTIKDAISLFEKVGSGAQKSAAIARRAAGKSLTKTETLNVLKQMEKAIQSDARLFRDFGGASAKGLKGMKNFKMSGMPRLFGNKAIRSLVIRTKFWAGFLDWLGLANFVGPDELKKEMGDEFDKKFNEYSQTDEAQQNWDSEFGGTDIPQDEQQPQEKQTDYGQMGKDFLTDLIFGPITSKAI
jgi:hypothetical protein